MSDLLPSSGLFDRRRAFDWPNASRNPLGCGRTFPNEAGAPPRSALPSGSPHVQHWTYSLQLGGEGVGAFGGRPFRSKSPESRPRLWAAEFRVALENSHIRLRPPAPEGFYIATTKSNPRRPVSNVIGTDFFLFFFFSAGHHPSQKHARSVGFSRLKKHAAQRKLWSTNF